MLALDGALPVPLLWIPSPTGARHSQDRSQEASSLAVEAYLTVPFLSPEERRRGRGGEDPDRHRHGGPHPELVPVVRRPVTHELLLPAYDAAADLPGKCARGDEGGARCSLTWNAATRGCGQRLPTAQRTPILWNGRIGSRRTFHVRAHKGLNFRAESSRRRRRRRRRSGTVRDVVDAIAQPGENVAASPSAPLPKRHTPYVNLNYVQVDH